MPLPRVDVSVVDEALHRRMVSRSDEPTILRLATGRPFTNQVLVDICAALERRLDTRVTCRLRAEDRPIVRGLGPAPIGFTQGRDTWIEVEVGRAPYDQLDEIERTLLEIVPIGTEVHVMAEDAGPVVLPEGGLTFGLGGTYVEGDAFHFDAFHFRPAKPKTIEANVSISVRTRFDRVLEDEVA